MTIDEQIKNIEKITQRVWEELVRGSDPLYVRAQLTSEDYNIHIIAIAFQKAEARIHRSW
jgi:hypothetical protein